LQCASSEMRGVREIVLAAVERDRTAAEIVLREVTKLQSIVEEREQFIDVQEEQIAVLEERVREDNCIAGEAECSESARLTEGALPLSSLWSGPLRDFWLQATHFELTSWAVPLLQAPRERVPVPLLRWTSRSVPGGGDTGGLYDTFDALWRGEISVADLEPLEVVLRGQELWSLSSHRLAVLKMLQALRSHVIVSVSCVLRSPDNPRFHAAMTTEACGLGINASTTLS